MDDRRTTLADVETRLTAAQARAVVVEQTRTAAQARLAAFRTVESQRIPWEDVLRDLSRVVPGSVVLQNLTATSPTLTGGVPGAAATPSAAGSPTGFTVSGSADSQVRVAQVLDRLALLPWLSNVTLQTSSRSGESESSTPSSSPSRQRSNTAGGG